MIVDFRVRPPIPEFTEGYPTDIASVAANAAKLGEPVSESWIKKSMELWLDELRAAGVSKTIVLGYWSLFRPISNDVIAEFQRRHPNLVIGFGAVDPLGSTGSAAAEIHRCITDLGLKGMYIEPGLALRVGVDESMREGVLLTDYRLDPVYRACVDLDVPLIVLTGPYAGRDISHTFPVLIDRVAQAYPRLKLICGHGCWPYSAEIFGVAYRRPNVYVSPDQYLYMPGSQGYIEGLRNPHLARQFLFASNYPYRSFKTMVRAFQELSIPDENRRAAFGENACRLLGL